MHLDFVTGLGEKVQFMISHGALAKSSVRIIPSPYGMQKEPQSACAMGASLYTLRRMWHKDSVGPTKYRRNGGKTDEGKPSFTLAEVLITLGIIGVVAALTLPALINKYQKVQYVTGLQKAYTVFNNGIKLLMADTGCDDIKCTGLFEGPVDDSTYNDNLEKMVRKYFKVVKVCKYGDDGCGRIVYRLHGATFGPMFDADGSFNNGLKFVTTDGILFSILPILTTEVAKEEGFSKIKYVAPVGIDINDKKKPNTRGRDTFAFRMAQDGLLYPYRSEEFAKFIAGSDWIDSSYYWKANNQMHCSMASTANTNGDGCAARIMENGWKMDY